MSKPKETHPKLKRIIELVNVLLSPTEEEGDKGDWESSYQSYKEKMAEAENKLRQAEVKLDSLSNDWPENAMPAVNADSEKKAMGGLNQLERLCREYLQIAQKVGGPQPKYPAAIKLVENVLKELALIRKPK